MERIAILGHSFVARLEQDLADGHIEGLHANLGLPENFTVKYFGVRDSNLNNLLNSKEFKECKAFHPTKVFLQIGEDDVGHKYISNYFNNYGYNSSNSYSGGLQSSGIR